MRRQGIVTGLGLLCFIVAVGTFHAKSRARVKTLNEHFSATFGIGNSVDIAISDYSTRADLQKLAQAYLQGGEKAFRKAIHKTKRGYFSFANSMTMPLLIVQSVPAGPLRKLTLVGGAPGWFSGPGASGYSVGNRGYPYTLIELDVNQDGKGQGLLYEFVNISFDKQGSIQVKPMYRLPERLQGVQLEK